MTLHDVRQAFVSVAAIAAFILPLNLFTASADAQAFIEAGDVVAPPRGAFVLCVEDRETCGLIPADGQEKPVEDFAVKEATGGPGSALSAPIITVAAVTRSALEPVRIIVPATVRSERERQEAAAPAPDETVMSDEVIMALAHVTNARFNALIRYRTDEVVWGVEERWVRPFSQFRSRVGDCEDYALEKRAALLEAGVPADRLRMAVVWSRSTGVHAVLVVRTAEGDFVLDNAVSEIRRVDGTGYEWRSVQSGAHLLSWARASISAPREPLST